MMGGYLDQSTSQRSIPMATKKPLAIIHLDAGHDKNGNPRRVYVVFGNDGYVIEAIDEGYYGHGAITSRKDLKGVPVLSASWGSRFATTYTEYKELLKSFSKRAGNPSSVTDARDRELLGLKPLKGRTRKGSAKSAFSAAEIRKDFLYHAAQAFYASAWADGEDRYGEGTGGSEILDIMPDDFDASAHRAAKRLATEIAKANKTTLTKLMMKIEEKAYGDREPTPENFGFYAAMTSMGSGVGLADAFGDVGEAIKVPYHEYSYYEFDEWPDNWDEAREGDD